MEEINDQSHSIDQRSVWSTVTPLSKCVAMTLFVLLPFLGGWVGYLYAPDKVVEIEKVIVREVEVPAQADNDVFKSKLFDSFGITRSLEDGEYMMSWSVSDDAKKFFTELDEVYITFALVPEEGVVYENQGVTSYSISDGFALDVESYSFNPKYYVENFSWELDWGSEYRVIARAIYQPQSFECDPLVKGECLPVFSNDDQLLLNETEDYIFFSEPFTLEQASASDSA